MQIPEEFKRLTRCFWQGSDREAKSRAEWIENAIKLNTAEQQVIIKKFLGDLLNQNLNAQELVGVWNSGGSSYGVQADAVRKFLEQIKDAIRN